VNWQTFKSMAYERKFSLLLVCLVAFVALQPVMLESNVGEWTFDVILLVVLSATVLATSRYRRQFIAAVILVAATVLSVIVRHFGAGLSGELATGMQAFFFVMNAAYLAFAAGVILFDVLHDRQVDVDKICGAICVYLMLGTLWAMLYALCEGIEPGSFALDISLIAAEEHGGPRPVDFSVFLYYSFVTLTTLGYGDVTPLSEAARTFTWIEAVAGQFYLAVLVARLVGLHLAGEGGAERVESRKPKAER